MAVKWVQLLRLWLPIAVALTALSALVYTAVQQDLRLSANDPQVQVSEDIAAALADGREASSLLPAGKVDVSKSLALIVILVDESGKATASSAELDGAGPLPPTGVFDYSRTHGQNRFTWQPARGARLATVVTHYSGRSGSGFVLAGRSIREVEAREDVVRNLVTVGLAAALAATLIVCGVVSLERT